jgi:ABC-type transport system involved in multi-copper enzyme maturation permease subunit
MAHLSWSLWLQQIGAILRLEVKKNFWSRRALLIYLLALAPVALVASLIFLDPEGPQEISSNWRQANIVFANLYQGLILRTVIFFGCAWMFMNLFRGEILDRSLHYYFLSPMRREMLVVGKYLSGLITTMVLFSGTSCGSLFFLYLARGSESIQYLLEGGGLSQVLSYLGITLLACLGYGAVFLMVGLFFRNPIIPGLVIYGWEWINFLLPPLLKKISIIHYLHSLSPVPISEGPFALVAEPTPAWISVAGMLALTAVVLLLSSLQVRRLEINYGGE